jgi:hypothetical protein
VAKQKLVKKDNTILRKIYFYQIVAVDPERKVDFDDLVNSVTEVHNIPWTNESRYKDNGDGNSVCMWCDNFKPQIRIKLGTRRTTGLPDVEILGNLTPLEIAANAGLSEQTHMIIYKDNILGSEFNFFGPRPQQVKYYLEDKTGINPIKLEMLLQKDMEKRLASFREIRLLRLRFKKSEAELLSEMAAGGLAETLKAVKNSPSTVIDLTLKNEKYSREPLLRQVFDSVKKLVKNSGSKEILEVFNIQGYNAEKNQLEMVDLLGDGLITSQQVIKQGPKQRNTNSVSMYDAINKSYIELRDSINKAATIG